MNRSNYILFLLILIAFTSCNSKKENTVEVQEELSTTQSTIDLPDVKDPELINFAKGYETYMQETLAKFEKEDLDGLKSIEFQNEFKEDSTTIQHKLESTLEEASPRDLALFQQYILAKQQEFQTRLTAIKASKN